LRHRLFGKAARVIALTAILLGASLGMSIDRNACGVAGARQVLVFAPYSDHDGHRVRVDESFELDVQSPLDGPVDFRDARSGALIHSLAREQWDGDVKGPNGEPLESDGFVSKVALPSGTLIVDRSSILSRDGPFLFVCWKAKTLAPVEISGRHPELYQGIELFDDGTRVIRRTDGSSIPLPTFRNQVRVEAAMVSDDGKRVGWLVDMPNCCTSYEVPMLLVIFANGKIERIIEEGQCIFDWAFVRKGSAVSYYTEVLHGSDFKSFFLRDVRNGALLGTYTYPDSGAQDWSQERAAAIQAAPAWVKALGSSDR
jgi:hypothetical protein